MLVRGSVGVSRVPKLELPFPVSKDSETIPGPPIEVFFSPTTQDGHFFLDSIPFLALVQQGFNAFLALPWLFLMRPPVPLSDIGLDFYSPPSQTPSQNTPTFIGPPPPQSSPLNPKPDLKGNKRFSSPASYRPGALKNLRTSPPNIICF